MHGLSTLTFLNDRYHEQHTSNAADPGRVRDARAQNDLDRALENLSRSIDEVIAADQGAVPEQQRRLNFPPDWSITRHADAYWALPLTVTARTVAASIIPAGTPRYGLHYILEGEVGAAIAESLIAAN
jgi:hypothetical protein